MNNSEITSLKRSLNQIKLPQKPNDGFEYKYFNISNNNHKDIEGWYDVRKLLTWIRENGVEKSEGVLSRPTIKSFIVQCNLYSKQLKRVETWRDIETYPGAKLSILEKITAACNAVKNMEADKVHNVVAEQAAINNIKLTTELKETIVKVQVLLDKLSQNEDITGLLREPDYEGLASILVNVDEDIQSFLVKHLEYLLQELETHDLYKYNDIGIWHRNGNASNTNSVTSFSESRIQLQKISLINNNITSLFVKTPTEKIGDQFII